MVLMMMGLLMLNADEPKTDLALAARVFEARQHEGAAGVLPYRFLAPETVKPSEKYPLVIFLHGAGERGDDNKAPLVHGIHVLLRPSLRAQLPCYAIAPQCPKERRWVEVDWSRPEHATPADPSKPMQLLVELLDKLQADLPIDADRVYVTGLSMGGYGTWDLVARHPGRFAAAIPVCGGADLATASKIKHLPIWVFHGDQDRAVPVARSRNMVEALKAVGSAVKYTEYPGVGHDSWSATYGNPEVWAWLFAQRRPTP